VKYTVILLLPDYVADVFGQDTYLAHVDAPNAPRAVALGQHEACAADGNDVVTDYYPLAVFAGHLDDLSEG
jgi:hypothetical protein